MAQVALASVLLLRAPAAAAPETAVRAHEEVVDEVVKARIRILPDEGEHLPPADRHFGFLVAAVIEAGLSEVPNTAVSVWDAPPAPGQAHPILLDAPTWTLSLHFERGKESLEAEAVLCRTPETCTTLSGSAVDITMARGLWDPILEGLAHELGAELALLQRYQPPEGVRGWSLDLAGRSAGVVLRRIAGPMLEDLRQKADPVARATWVDDALLVSTWLLGRRELARGAPRFSANAFRELIPRGGPARAADATASALAAGWTDAAWELSLPLRHDARYVVLAAQAALARGRSDQVQTIATSIPRTWRQDPAWLEFAASSAAGEVRTSALDHWMDAWPADPRPAELGLDDALRRGDMEDAHRFSTALVERAGPERAGSMGAAVALARDDRATALRLAQEQGDAAFVVALERADKALAEPGPIGIDLNSARALEVVEEARRLLSVGKATSALKYATQARKRWPHLSDALLVQAQAYAKLGRGYEAERAWYDLYLLDPAFAVDAREAR